MTDPFGGLNGVFERLFGIKSETQVNLKLPRVTPSSEQTDGPRNRSMGIEFTVRWE